MTFRAWTSWRSAAVLGACAFTYWQTRHGDYKTYVLNKVCPPARAAAPELKNPSNRFKVLAKDDKSPVKARNSREERFLSFASVEYDGEPYMTPQDFLESVTQDKPRFRRHRKQLTKLELEAALKKTPSRWWTSNSSKTLFRGMYTDGVISYSEYIFLLCILAKPKSGFEIAFKMIDVSRNNQVDKQEFTMLCNLMSRENITNSPETSDSAALDTTLMLYFFGKKGKDTLRFQDFAKFMDNLQTEVLEMEFSEFSRGLNNISETEFARVLLRYTNLSEEQKNDYIERITTKLIMEEGINFNDFKQFFQFLNSLEDFSLAMKMYTLAGQPINQEEFQRAVKACVGYTLPPHVVATVFLLFDNDDDGHLSYQEFLSILRDRLQGLLSRPVYQDSHWDSFKRCVAKNIREEV